MLKKLLALVATAALAVTLTACTGTGEQLPGLTLETSSASTSSTTSGVDVPTASDEEDAQVEIQVEEVPDTEFEDTIDGLCDYLSANKAVTGDPTEMAYETIGATEGYRFRFILGKSTVQVEVYSFDLDNLGDQAQAVLDSVREKGSFTMLDNEVPATLNSDGKYLLIYTDTSTDATNVAQKERVTELFTSFYAE